METLQEFKKRIQGQTTKVYKVRNSLGVYDAYKYYRKHKPKDKKFILKESLYFSIIRRTNQELMHELLNGNDITLPKSMGKIEIRKYDTTIKVGKDNTIYTNLPIDWSRTLELWYTDEEAYLDKTLIRVEEKEIFKIYYNKATANYNNNSYYEFLFNKELRKELKQKIKGGLIDAPYLGRKVKYG